jgi:hypothetical protein
LVLKQDVAINQGKFCFVILFQKSGIVIFVIIFQNLTHACTGKTAALTRQTSDVLPKNYCRLFAICAFGAKVIKTNPAHRPVKAQFMANRWMRSLGAIHALANRTANANLVKPRRF